MSDYNKPILLMAMSTLLLVFIYACFSLIIFVGGKEYTISIIPLVSFVLLRAVIAGFQPVPSNFHEDFGRVRFLVSNGQALSVLCFSYSILKITTDVSNEIIQYGRVTVLSGWMSQGSYLWAFGVAAFFLIVVSFIFTKIYNNSAVASKAPSDVWLLMGVCLYFASTFMASAYAISVLEILQGKTIAEYFYMQPTSVSVVVLFSILLFGFVAFQDVTIKWIMSIKLGFWMSSLIRLSKSKSQELLYQGGDFPQLLIWKNLPVVPGVSFVLIFKMMEHSWKKSAAILLGVFLFFAVPFGGLIISTIALKAGANLTEVIQPLIRSPLTVAAVLFGSLVILVVSATMSIWPIAKAKTEKFGDEKNLRQMLQNLNRFRSKVDKTPEEEEAIQILESQIRVLGQIRVSSNFV